MRGELTKIKKKEVSRSFDLLMHPNIYGPLILTLCGNKYFVIFIDDFSHYGYLFLIKEKYDTSKNFKKI